MKSERMDALGQWLAEPTVAHRNVLVSQYRYLCRRGARKFYRRIDEFADLEQIAAIGLIKACERFRASYETPFEAFAWLFVVGELMHYTRDVERAVRIPRSLIALERRYHRAMEEFVRRHDREPTTRELAEALDISTARVDEVRVLRTRPLELASETTASSDDAIAGVDEQLAIRVALAALGERERAIVGAIVVHGLSQSQVGARFSLSQRHVSRLYRRAMLRIEGELSA